MKFQLISKCGEGAHLLYRIAQEGNEVGMKILEPAYKDVFAGLLPRDEMHTSKDTIFIFDSSGMGKTADQMKKFGRKVFGASLFADKLEEDREFGVQVMQEAGIKVPEYQEFTDFSSAYQFLQQQKGRFVFKPSGDAPCKLTYVPKDTEDLLSYMKFVEKKYKVKTFILQQFIEGKTVSSEFWCDGTKFVRPANHTVEVKKFMNDDLGPSTGCSGNLVWLSDDKIVAEVAKVEKICAKENFVGCIDLNAIVNDDGVFGLEWTPRFGLDAMPTFLQFLDGDVGELISSFASGSGNFSLHEGFAGGVRLSIPPYPIEPKDPGSEQDVSPNVGVPIRGFKNVSSSNIYFYEVMCDKGQLVHSGGTGAICVVSDLTDTLHVSFDYPYKVLEECSIPDKQYRTDLTEVLVSAYEEVNEYGN